MRKRDQNQAAYRKLKESIDKNYPRGRFVAISGGRIVADAETFDALDKKLLALGDDSAETLVVQAGVQYPDNVTIFL